MSEYVTTINGDKKFVNILNHEKLFIDDKQINYSLTKIGPFSYILKIEDNLYEVTVSEHDPERYGILIDGHYMEITVRTRLREKAIEIFNLKKKQIHHEIIKAPMPGMILKIKKKQGDTVQMGESILILEAMKMENDLRSPSSGTIKEIFAKEGDSVEKDSILLRME